MTTSGITDGVGFDLAGGIGTVLLDRPRRLNAFDVPMLERLLAVVEAAHAEPRVRCLVLRGAGRAFSAGQDLGDPAVQPDAPGGGVDVIERYYNPLARLLATAPFPTIASVNGVAAGAGASVALCCDLVIAAESARFVQSFSQLGLIPDTGATYWMPRLVGRARALGLSLLGDPLPAVEAAAFGLIWRAVPDASLEAETLALATKLASRPRAGAARIRMALDATWRNDLHQQLELEHRLQLEAGRSPEYAEAVAAFRQQRVDRSSPKGS